MKKVIVLSRVSTSGQDLTQQTDEVLVKYATTGLANQLFVSKYQLYLPDEMALRHEVQRILEQE